MTTVTAPSFANIAFTKYKYSDETHYRTDGKGHFGSKFVPGGRASFAGNRSQQESQKGRLTCLSCF